jgi:hypothetical protein
MGKVARQMVEEAGPLLPHEAARLADGTLRGDALDCPVHRCCENSVSKK